MYVSVRVGQYNVNCFVNGEFTRVAEGPSEGASEGPSVLDSVYHACLL